MEYITVIGTDPGQHRTSHIFKYFRDYLISLGEPTTSPGWTINSIYKHMQHIIERSKKFDQDLYIDSGGYQIIQGYIKFDPSKTKLADRIIEFIDVYHYCLCEFYEDVYRIFSLDVNNFDMTFKQLYDFNVYSITESIKLIKEKPAIADKQLFVMQTRNHRVFEIWKRLFVNLEIYKYYKLWSFGGLVGLKKDTNAKFSHVIPSTLWLLTYQKHFNFKIEQLHFLGQGSRLNFLVVALLEELYDLNITCDSSQLVRFAPPDSKLPFIYIKEEARKYLEVEDFTSVSDEDFTLVTKNNLEVLEQTFIEENYSKDVLIDSLYKTNVDQGLKNIKNMLDDLTLEQNNDLLMHIENDNIEEIKKLDYITLEADEIVEKFKKYNLMNSTQLIEMMSITTRNDMHFSKYIKYKLMSIGLENITLENLKTLHPIMGRGQIALEMFNNINFIKAFKPIIENGDIQKADSIMYSVIDSYENRKV